MNSLNGKAVVITGAGQGIGAAYARYFAAEGARVVVNDIDAELAGDVVRSIRGAGGSALARVADISAWGEAQALVEFCVQEFGSLDGLVNNAAIYYLSSPLEETEEHFRRIVEVNLLGAAWCGIHALRQMLKQGHGSLVNGTSGAQAGLPGGAAYGATKGALASMTYAWALDVQDQRRDGGVRVNAIAPMASTRMSQTTAEYRHKAGYEPRDRRFIDPVQNAPLVCYLLSDYARGINGQVVRVQGGEINLMTRPAILLPSVNRAQWTVEEIRDAFDRDLGKRQFPPGIVALEATVSPYRVA